MGIAKKGFQGILSNARFQGIVSNARDVLQTLPFGNTFRTDYVKLLKIRSGLGPPLPRHPDVATTKLLPNNLFIEERSSEAAARSQTESAFKFYVDCMPSQDEENLAASSSKDYADDAAA